LQNQETTVSQTVPGMHSQNLLTITHGRGDFSQLLLFFFIFFLQNKSGCHSKGQHTQVPGNKVILTIPNQDLHKIYLCHLIL